MKKLLLITITPLLLYGCNNFLDKNPDNRTEIDSEEKIAEVLVNAYPKRHWAYITEMRSDETDYNGDDFGTHTSMQQECFFWGDVPSTHMDSPENLWTNYYYAIAHANLALEAIEEFGNPQSLDPYRGEALICRAFSHFILVNLFSKHYNTATSGNDLGIPYIEEVETEPFPKYDRSTVANVYAKIERDLEEALPLIDDQVYAVPKYHFNKVAAYAFASRFYLYKGDFDKVVKYSTLAIGSNVEGKLRDWLALSSLTYNGIPRRQLYVDSKLGCNIMIWSFSSYWSIVGNFGYYPRYSNNRPLQRTEGRFRSGLWGEENELNLRGTTFLGNPSYVTFKLGDLSGYMLMPMFTIEEMLINRAEAYVRLSHETGNDMLDLTVDDINMILSTFSELGGYITRETVTDFYGDDMEYYRWNDPTPKKAVDPQFGFSGEIEAFIHGILHLRRALFIHEGYRWFDVKRYGIEIYRREMYEEVLIRALDFLPRDDERRAFQLPESVIKAGMTPNPR